MHTYISISVFLLVAIGLGATLSFLGGDSDITGAAVACGQYCDSTTSCNDYNPCTVDACANTQTCGNICQHESITKCVNSDKCCPVGCSGLDNDCS